MRVLQRFVSVVLPLAVTLSLLAFAQPAPAAAAPCTVPNSDRTKPVVRLTLIRGPNQWQVPGARAVQQQLLAVFEARKVKPAVVEAVRAKAGVYAPAQAKPNKSKKKSGK